MDAGAGGFPAVGRRLWEPVQNTPPVTFGSRLFQTDGAGEEVFIQPAGQLWVEAPPQPPPHGGVGSVSSLPAKEHLQPAGSWLPLGKCPGNRS